jgi:hypothetical protein
VEECLLVLYIGGKNGGEIEIGNRNFLNLLNPIKIP